MIQMENVKLSPWIGDRYLHEKNKILVLGESCFTDEPEEISSDFVTDMISGLIFDGWKYPYFTKIYNIFTHLAYFTGLDVSSFWQKVAFYEFVQEALTGARVRPNARQWHLNNNAFNEVLNVLSPDFVFCFGRELFKNLPEFGGEEAATYKVKAGLKSVKANTWKYSVNGKITHVLEIEHPSSVGFSYEPWIKIISKFSSDYFKL